MYQYLNPELCSRLSGELGFRGIWENSKFFCFIYSFYLNVVLCLELVSYLKENSELYKTKNKRLKYQKLWKGNLMSKKQVQN